MFIYKIKKKIKKKNVGQKNLVGLYGNSTWPPGPPEDTETIRCLSLKIKTKNPGNFVTPTADTKRKIVSKRDCRI